MLLSLSIRYKTMTSETNEYFRSKNIKGHVLFSICTTRSLEHECFRTDFTCGDKGICWGFLCALDDNEEQHFYVGNKYWRSRVNSVQCMLLESEHDPKDFDTVAERIVRERSRMRKDIDSEEEIQREIREQVVLYHDIPPYKFLNEENFFTTKYLIDCSRRSHAKELIVTEDLWESIVSHKMDDRLQMIIDICRKGVPRANGAGVRDMTPYLTGELEIPKSEFIM